MPIPGHIRFKFTDKDFNFIRNLVFQHAGINLNEGKRELVYGRLSKRLRYLNLNNFKEYCNIINDDSEELVNCINEITTNVTSFFRENHHFDYLTNTIIPQLLSDPLKLAKKRLRIWSAGCSTGEEAYSIEMILRRFTELDYWDTRILATDLSTDVLQVAREGIYRRNQLENVPDKIIKTWFRYSNNDENVVKINPDLKKRIYFNQLNLNKEWPMRGSFDVIFCRNVVIYFNKETQIKLFDRFADILSDDGYLIIGHSESMFGVSERFKLVDRTIYKKIK